uniref:Uncharacterized protein n=1 Tax=virus sp. ctBS918 TaxID=2825807 RepID=A0A8S5RPD0_9VIRU|nr:MAG TPA: hypothetical protein [virus sp. ctBS918]
MPFHWKFNIGNYEKSFRMRWLLFYIEIKRRWSLVWLRQKRHSP